MCFLVRLIPYVQEHITVIVVIDVTGRSHDRIRRARLVTVSVIVGVRVGRVGTVNVELVTIGDDCFVGHGVMFINDLFDEGGPSGAAEKWKSTAIGNHVSIGSNATILPVSICDNVVIGAGAVVTKDISTPGIYAGNPAKLLRTLPEQA